MPEKTYLVYVMVICVSNPLTDSVWLDIYGTHKSGIDLLIYTAPMRMSYNSSRCYNNDYLNFSFWKASVDHNCDVQVCFQRDHIHPTPSVCRTGKSTFFSTVMISEKSSCVLCFAAWKSVLEAFESEKKFKIRFDWKLSPCTAVRNFYWPLLASEWPQH